MTDTVLWDYPKSSASYRVRIALNLAGIGYHVKTVNLLAMEQKSPEHLARNPQGFVPVLDIDGLRLTQSLAILEYLDTSRHIGLLPADPGPRANVRALAYALAVDVHPICNLGVATHASHGKEAAKTAWMHHFIRPGLLAFEALLEGFEQRPFSTGPAPSMADLCLIPQLYNARRWDIDYRDCPLISSVESACAMLPAFRLAAPA